MPKLPFLRLLAALTLLAAPAAAGPTNAHFDPTKFVKPCSPCHQGHGAPGTPRLAGGTTEFCLKCHETASRSAPRKAALGLGGAANPQDIRTEFTKPVTHSRATCFECHSAHVQKVVVPAGFQAASPKRPLRFEVDLCLSCHGTRGLQGADPHDLSKLFVASNPSYHPILAGGHPAGVPSLLAPYTAASLMNCTDCHTNDDPSGPRGPHGSRVLKLLGRNYSLVDGQVESASTYALCYGCHGRDSILSDVSFSLHRKHVVDVKASCATCHNPHGATAARALVRFNEPFPTSGVTASSSGRLEFISTSPSRGTCYLTCHGKNHDPLTYGRGATGTARPVATPAVGRGGQRVAAPQVAPLPQQQEPRKAPEPPKQ